MSGSILHRFDACPSSPHHERKAGGASASADTRAVLIAPFVMLTVFLFLLGHIAGGHMKTQDDRALTLLAIEGMGLPMAMSPARRSVIGGATEALDMLALLARY